MALGTDQRDIAAALAVASQSFSDQKVVVMVIVVAIVGLIIFMPLARALAHPRLEKGEIQGPAVYSASSYAAATRWLPGK